MGRRALRGSVPHRLRDIFQLRVVRSSANVGGRPTNSWFQHTRSQYYPPIRLSIRCRRQRCHPLFANGYRTDVFGFEGFLVTVIGGSGGTQTAGPWYAATRGTSSFCTPGMTWTGDILATIDAGATYNFFIEDQSNIHGGLGDRTALWNASFDFTIPSSNPARVPKPPSFVLSGSGLVILAHFLRMYRIMRSGRRSQPSVPNPERPPLKK